MSRRRARMIRMSRREEMKITNPGKFPVGSLVLAGCALVFAGLALVPSSYADACSYGCRLVHGTCKKDARYTRNAARDRCSAQRDACSDGCSGDDANCKNGCDSAYKACRAAVPGRFSADTRACGELNIECRAMCGAIEDPACSRTCRSGVRDCLRSAKYEAAVALLQTQRRSRPDRALALFGLERAYAGQGNAEQARRYAARGRHLWRNSGADEQALVEATPPRRATASSI